MRTIVRLMQQGKSEATRLGAASLILERGWGKAIPDSNAIDDNRLIVEIVYRTVEAPPMKVIEHQEQ